MTRLSYLNLTLFGQTPDTVVPWRQARGEVAEDDVSLWGCLAKVRDHKTGESRGSLEVYLTLEQENDMQMGDLTSCISFPRRSNHLLLRPTEPGVCVVGLR